METAILILLFLLVGIGLSIYGIVNRILENLELPLEGDDVN